MSKQEIRNEMRAIFESVMILESTSAIAYRQAMNDRSKKAESLKVNQECIDEVRLLRKQYDSLKRIHDELD